MEGQERQGLVIRVLNYGLVAAVTGLLLGTYPVLVALFCVPLLDYSLAWGISVLVVYHLLLLLTLASYYRTVFTDTSVPSSYSHADSVESGEGTALERKKKSSELRVCSKCMGQDKPDRAHHCRHCGKCVLKMDHHCPWVNNCVGWKNYKFFMLFITYTPILCLFMLVNLALAAILTWTWGDFTWEQILLIGVGALGGIFFLTLVGFSAMHYRLVLSNATTIESMENIYSSSISPYDVGAYRNFCQVFGKNPLLWFLPWANMDGNGVTFPANRRLTPPSEVDKSGADAHDNSLLEEDSLEESLQERDSEELATAEADHGVL